MGIIVIIGSRGINGLTGPGFGCAQRGPTGCGIIVDGLETRQRRSFSMLDGRNSGELLHPGELNSSTVRLNSPVRVSSG